MPRICDINHDNSDNIGKIEKLEILCDEYFHGELSPKEMREFEEHIKECEMCARIFESTRKYFGAIKQAEHTSKTDIAASVMEKIITERRTVDRPRRRRRIPFGLIGAAVIVLFIALNYNLDLLNDIMRGTDNFYDHAGTAVLPNNANENDIYSGVASRIDDHNAFNEFASEEFHRDRSDEIRIEAATILSALEQLPPEVSVHMSDEEMWIMDGDMPPTEPFAGITNDLESRYFAPYPIIEEYANEEVRWSTDVEMLRIMPSEIIRIYRTSEFEGLPKHIRVIEQHGRHFIIREQRDILLSYLNRFGIRYEIEELLDVDSDFIIIHYID